MADRPRPLTVRIGARRSPLARTQADHVAALLTERGVQSEFVGITTVGDTDARRLTEIGGTGVFVSGVRDAIVRGEVDLAVHSLKDLPTAPADGLLVAAVPPREDTRDVLIGCRLIDLRGGLRIGTGAPRRSMQLLALGAQRGLDLVVEPVRGNVDTRLGLVRRGT
ncbi:MAG: hydroxymethylbilane synthase, partial [Actinomycetes bacterium]